MTRIEGLRREKQQEKDFLRAQRAKQESLRVLESFDDNTRYTPPEDIIYVHLQ